MCTGLRGGCSEKKMFSIGKIFEYVIDSKLKMPSPNFESPVNIWRRAMSSQGSDICKKSLVFAPFYHAKENNGNLKQP